MDLLHVIVIVAVGAVAGAINVIVGSGTLLTFPTLVGFGYDPLTANVSNTIGCLPGTISGAVGYRRELVGQAPRAVRLGSAALAGGIVGAVLLLALPTTAFDAVIPFLILFAAVTMGVQPWLASWVARRRGEGAGHALPLWLIVFFTAIYGGYFGAAQGVVLMAAMGVFLVEHVQRLNALKNVLVGIVNGVAALIFAIIAPVDWWLVLMLAVGSTVGGQVGAVVGRRLPAAVLRLVVVVVGVTVAVVMFLR